MAVGPRWVVADELLMAALKVGNPIQSFIQVEGDDFSHRPSYFCLHRFHTDQLLETSRCFLWGTGSRSRNHAQVHMAENDELVGGLRGQLLKTKPGCLEVVHFLHPLE